MTPETAALLAAIILLGLALFHAALALGVPWGAYAWGGEAKGALPPRLQMGSALMTPLLGAMALMVLVRGGWLYAGQERAMVWPVWAIFCFLVTMMFGSFRSPSVAEKRRMGPVLLAGAVLVGYLALNG